VCCLYSRRTSIRLLDSAGVPAVALRIECDAFLPAKSVIRAS
jgi:hypothetical protein